MVHIAIMAEQLRQSTDSQNMQHTINSSDQQPITSTLLEEEPELIDLIVKFVELLPKRIADISSATNEQDWPALKSQLHTFKGLSANFGFQIISRLTQQIEDTLSHQQFANIAPLLEELDSLCQRVSVGHADPRMLKMSK